MMKIILRLATAGIISLFLVLPALAATPNAYVTRAEAVMLLLHMSGVEAKDIRGSQFPDIPEGVWYTRQIHTAVSLGLLSPDPTTGLIYPDQDITRAGFLKMIAIAFRLPTNLPHSFLDVQENTWYLPYAGIAYQYGLFKDKLNPSMLYPDSTITHQEAIKVIYKLFKAQPNLRRRFRFDISRISRSNLRRARLAKRTRVTLSASNTRMIFERPILKQKTVSLAPKRKEYATTLAMNDVLLKVNTEREKAGLNPLHRNSLLDKAAQEYAKDMYRRDFYSHVSPEGTTHVDRIRNAGYFDIAQRKCGCYLVDARLSCTCQTFVGENVASGLKSSTIMRMWMDSAKHRANILNPNFQDIGIGFFGNKWVQTFGGARRV